MPKGEVDIRVVVDDVTFKSYKETIDYLEQNEGPIKLDPKKGVTAHVKIMVIDGKHVFVGSHNWTESALSYNNEYSVLIHSRQVAEEIIEYFVNLWDNGRTP